MPRYTEANMGAFKNIFIGPSERFNVQFRAEVVNAFNHPVFNGPDTGVNDADYGLILPIKYAVAVTACREVYLLTAT